MTDIALLSELENKLKILIEELKHARESNVPSKADEKLKRIEVKVKNLIQLLDQI
ncbi:MAG: hypothetical protein GXO92_07715 [FCB group bacterium]|nr:hypothetical protein [FCB group bacterium]